MSIIEPRTATVEIFTGDYLDRINYLEQRAEAAKEAADADGPRLNHEVPEYLTIAQEHDELVTEARAAATKLEVQHLPRKVWKALVKAHPPRTAGDDVTEAAAAFDTRWGVNTDTFKDALVYGGEIEVDGVPTPYETIIGPEGITEADIDALADIDFDRVYYAAMGLNRGEVPDPKASLVSRLTQTSDETSS